MTPGETYTFPMTPNACRAMLDELERDKLDITFRQDGNVLSGIVVRRDGDNRSESK